MKYTLSLRKRTMINVACELPVYEQDGKEKPVGKQLKMTIESHWNRKDMVVLRFGDAIVTVLGYDLIRAATNATSR